MITREEAVTRIEPASLDQLLHPTIDPAAERKVIAPDWVATLGPKGYQTDYGYLTRAHPPILREAVDYSASSKPSSPPPVRPQ